ncbi:unnamed protein product [Closterium sp. Yama58-4]|nr:unnamed protein product [Closterium sp. Yama58-4]
MASSRHVLRNALCAFRSCIRESSTLVTPRYKHIPQATSSLPTPSFFFPLVDRAAISPQFHHRSPLFLRYSAPWPSPHPHAFFPPASVTSAQACNALLDAIVTPAQQLHSPAWWRVTWHPQSTREGVAAAALEGCCSATSAASASFHHGISVFSQETKPAEPTSENQQQEQQHQPQAAQPRTSHQHSPNQQSQQARRRFGASGPTGRQAEANKSQLMYLVAAALAMLGAAYASVPLYRLFCQATGFGGTTQRKETVEEKVARQSADKSAAAARELVIHFNADVAEGLPWRFIPTQREVRVRPGQSTLAFYTAHNKSDKPITGVSTYNVSPMKAGIYFNKIQCFCFEEQRLQPGETIDMPVFFYIDPEFATDPQMKNVNHLTLSYTFFRVDSP